MKNILLTITLLFVSTLAQGQTWQQLDSLGQALTKQQKFKEADSILQIALKKVEVQHGKDTSYAKVAIKIGLTYFQMHRYEQAQSVYQESLSIIETFHGKLYPAYSTVLSRLVNVYSELGNYKESNQIIDDYMTILKKEGMTKNISYANFCSQKGTLYARQGLYYQAEPFMVQAKELRGELLGKQNVEYGRSCYLLANIYQVGGLYDKAEPLYLEARSIIEQALGKKDIFYSALLNSLGILYFDLGLFDKAEALYIEAINILEGTVGKNHPYYVLYGNNLANIYMITSRNEKALPIQIEIIKIREARLGTLHPENVGFYGNLANQYKVLARYAEAEAYYNKSLSISLNAYNNQHPEYARAVYNLASMYIATKEYQKADSLLKLAIPVLKTSLGIGHIDYQQANFAAHRLYRIMQKYDKAEEYLRETTLNQLSVMKDIFSILSESEKNSYWVDKRHFYEAYYKFFLEAAQQKPEMTSILQNQILNTKGIIFSSTQKIKNTILNSGDTVLVNQYNNWKKQRESYTKLYQLPLEEQKKQNLDLEGMKNQINDLEKDLSKKSALFGQNVQTKSYKWQEVKAKLAKNEVVIEIIKSDSAYIALFLTAQTENYPAFYLFKNAQELEDKFLNYYKNCIEFKIEDTVSYNAFWKPIADKLSTLNKKGFKKIYFSPDGVFHQLSLNTLKNTKTGKFLLEEANIQLIGSSRDLIELNKKSRDLSQNYENYQAHLLGYPIYGAENTEKEPEKKRDRSLGFSGMQSAVGVAGAVSLLPGTKKEVENVFGLFNQKKLKVNLLLAENATEEAVKNLKSPTILHVATHGFFIPEISDKEVKSIQDAMNRNLLKNPFMRSGLLLAGCQKPNPEGEDGILTAEEVMNLTLDNTELVVMSACETGLGDIQAGEGVFGLQRAFQQAGAKSVLMSLWKVDDEATQTLMTEFYTALLKGQSKRQAFKTAQMNLRKRFPEPYYWGAFVMVGE